jgi:predicted aspartyl protease
MGTFTTPCQVINLYDRSKKTNLDGILVDTGSEYTWIPRKQLEAISIELEKKDIEFVMANGQVVTRSIGFGLVKIGEHFTVDELVFAEEGDLLLLGARTLGGLNLSVDPGRKKPVASGPLPAASLDPTPTPPAS